MVLKSFAWECQQKQGERAHFRRFQISSSCGCKGHEGESFACDFQFERGPCWEGVFRVNHLLPSPFNLAQGPTLLSKSLVSRPALEEFLLRCLK